MILTANAQAVRSSRKPVHLSGGGSGWETGYFGPRKAPPGPEVFPSPQAFVVEMDAGAVVLPHFHDHDQFQVFIAGSGLVGRHAVSALSVHYANRQTAYGPITAGKNGVMYFVLRQVCDAGAAFLPASKSLQDREAPKLQLISEAISACDTQALRELHEPALTALTEPRGDGLAAWMLRIPSGAAAALPRADGATGRFYIVTAGSLHLGDEQLPKLSPVFVSSDETAFEMRAGDEGLEVMVLQFPGDDRVLARLHRAA